MVGSGVGSGGAGDMWMAVAVTVGGRWWRR